MKKLLLLGTVATVLGTTSAFATTTTAQLTTKKYVDDGLKSVYTTVKGLAESAQTTADAAQTAANAAQADVDSLTTYVGAPSVGETPASGLTARIESLEEGYASIPENTLYTGVNGVSVGSGRQVSVNGLSTATGTDGKIYVFQNNVATELNVADTWNYSVLN